MKKTFIAMAVVLMIAGCTNAERGAVGGGAVGALAGQAIGGNTESTLIGAFIGSVGGYLVGRQSDRNGYCQYRKRNGDTFYERCPDGYY